MKTQSLTKLAAVMIILLFFVPTAVAQNPTVQFLSGEMRFGDKVVKGAPYSAEAVIEHTQTLGDGSKLTSRSTAKIYRNTEGATHRDQELNPLGSLAAAEDATATTKMRVIFISDPVARVYYRVNPKFRAAVKIPFENLPPVPGSHANAAARTEALGKKMIEGIEAEGTRSVITIPVGRLGNERPLEIVSERWISPELQIVLLSKHSDPRMGENTYRLINIKRGEPDASFFTVPPGYRIRDNESRPGPGFKPTRSRKPQY